jgi:hypothetical protein
MTIEAPHYHCYNICPVLRDHYIYLSIVRGHDGDVHDYDGDVDGHGGDVDDHDGAIDDGVSHSNSNSMAHYTGRYSEDSHNNLMGAQ